MKTLTASAKGNERQDFLSEIEMMKKVAEGQNPHVVCLLGCVTIQEPLCLITEFVKYGDLLSYLRTNRKMVQLVCSVSITVSPTITIHNRVWTVAVATKSIWKMMHISSLETSHLQISFRLPTRYHQEWYMINAFSVHA